MTSLSKYNRDIDSLASKLHKLLKVIRHSDPSAEELKHLLHEKYQNQLTSIARKVKERYLWEDFREYIVSQIESDSSALNGENSAAIRKKLISDFEKQFIARQVLSEFSAPDPKEIRRRREARERRRKEAEARMAASEKKYSKSAILEMVQTTRQQRQARTKLKGLIDAIRKADPQKIETKISQSLKSKDLT